MKVTLLSRWFNLSLRVAIRKDSSREFNEIYQKDILYNTDLAFDAVMNDVDCYRNGFEPYFISAYTAKRICTFFGPDDTNFFNRLDYAHR